MEAETATRHAHASIVVTVREAPVDSSVFCNSDWPETVRRRPKPREGSVASNARQRCAHYRRRTAKIRCAAAIAFTWTGLQKRLSADALGHSRAVFGRACTRSRLRDWRQDQGPVAGTVIEGGPRWSANIPARKEAPNRVSAHSATPTRRRARNAKSSLRRRCTAVAPLRRGRSQVGAWPKGRGRRSRRPNVKIVHRLPLDLQLDANDIGANISAFADGMSQPIPFDERAATRARPTVSFLAMASMSRATSIMGCRSGNSVGAHTRIMKGARFQWCSTARRRANRLTTEGAPEGFRNFGLDGSYMVVRELKQRVAAFWHSLETGAARIRAHDPSATHITADWLAERLVGRNLDGHLLCPGGVLPPASSKQPDNAFRFWETDPDGYGCPLGSHVRRANPRDGLANELASTQHC